MADDDNKEMREDKWLDLRELLYKWQTDNWIPSKQMAVALRQLAQDFSEE